MAVPSVGILGLIALVAGVVGAPLLLSLLATGALVSRALGHEAPRGARLLLPELPRSHKLHPRSLVASRFRPLWCLTLPRISRMVSSLAGRIVLR